MSCELCPCHDICLQRLSFCEWALTGEKSKLDHICMRSALGENPNVSAAISVQSEKTVISTGNGGIQAVPTQDAMQLNKEIRECPHYNKISNCGCGRARCMIGKGGEIDKATNDGTSLVSFWDCAACLRPNMEIYTQNAYKKLS
jgi:hypothetical protein